MSRQIASLHGYLALAVHALLVALLLVKLLAEVVQELGPQASLRLAILLHYVQLLDFTLDEFLLFCNQLVDGFLCHAFLFQLDLVNVAALA